MTCWTVEAKTDDNRVIATWRFWERAAWRRFMRDRTRHPITPHRLESTEREVEDYPVPLEPAPDVSLPF
jgi:hypothetical protein